MARKKKDPEIKAPPRYVECMDGRRFAIMFTFSEGATLYGIELGHTGSAAALFAMPADECKDISEEIVSKVHA